MEHSIVLFAHLEEDKSSGSSCTCIFMRFPCSKVKNAILGWFHEVYGFAHKRRILVHMGTAANVHYILCGGLDCTEDEELECTNMDIVGYMSIWLLNPLSPERIWQMVQDRFHDVFIVLRDFEVYAFFCDGQPRPSLLGQSATTL